MRSFVRLTMTVLLTVGVVTATAHAQSGTRSWAPGMGFGTGAGAPATSAFGGSPPMPTTGAGAWSSGAYAGQGAYGQGAYSQMGSAYAGQVGGTYGQMGGGMGSPAASYGSPAMSYGSPATGYAAPAMNGGMMGSIYGAPSAVTAAPSVAAPAASAPMAAPAMGPEVSAPMVTEAAPMAATYTGEAAAGPVMGGAISGPVVGTQMGAPYMDSMQSGSWQPVYGQVAQSGSWQPVYGQVPNVRTNGAPRWFGGIYGLVMDRDDANEVYFLTAPSTADSLSLSSGDAQMETSGGYEVRFGRTFGGGNWGVEAIYWELLPDNQSATFNSDGVLPAYSTIDYRDVFVDFGDDYPYGPDDVRPVPASIFTEGGNIFSARVDRSFDFQNIELNFISRPIYAGGGLRAGRARPFGRGLASRIGGGLGGGYGGGLGGYGGGLGGYGGGSAACGSSCDPCGDTCGDSCAPQPACGPRLHIGWLAGVRYFRFDESLRVTYNRLDPLVPNAGLSTLQHEVSAENDLVGFQLGLNMDYYLSNRLQFETGSRFGLYGNNISVNQRVYTDFANGLVGTAGALQDFDINTSDQVVSFLGEIRAGLAYKLGCHWRVTGGYRGLAASRVALATNQIPFGRSFNGITKANQVQSNGDLILHGAYAGLEFAW